MSCDKPRKLDIIITDALANGPINAPQEDGAAPPESPLPEAGEGWREPDPLDPAGDLSGFPVDVLPGWLGDYTRELSRWMETPPGLAGMLALSVVATACARRVQVEVKPDYSEPVNLYVMVCMGPGTRKSPVLAKLTEPLLAWEREQIALSRPRIAGAKALRATAEKRLKHAQDKAARATEPEQQKGAEREVAELARALEELQVPEEPCLLAGDITPEALILKLNHGGGRLASLSAEGGIFATLGGRYSSGVPNLDGVLQAWSGDTIKVDRMNREPILILNPALTLGLAVQPDVLTSAMDAPGMRGRGLLARFLYVVPRSTIGARTFGEGKIPGEVKRTYAEGVGALLALRPPEEGESIAGRLLRLSPPARERWRSFARDLDLRIAEGGDLAVIVDWGSKLPGNVARVAGLLHLAEHAHLSDPVAECVSLETMERAIRLGDYLIPHALTALDAAGADPVRAGARHLLGWLRRQGCSEVSHRDLHQGNRSTFPRVADMGPAVSLLVEAGWLRRRPKQKTGGRRSPGYLVHPSLLSSQNTQKPQNGDERSSL